MDWDLIAASEPPRKQATPEVEVPVLWVLGAFLAGSVATLTAQALVRALSRQADPPCTEQASADPTPMDPYPSGPPALYPPPSDSAPPQPHTSDPASHRTDIGCPLVSATSDTAPACASAVHSGPLPAASSASAAPSDLSDPVVAGSPLTVDQVQPAPLYPPDLLSPTAADAAGLARALSGAAMCDALASADVSEPQQGKSRAAALAAIARSPAESWTPPDLHFVMNCKRQLAVAQLSHDAPALAAAVSFLDGLYSDMHRVLHLEQAVVSTPVRSGKEQRALAAHATHETQAAASTAYELLCAELVLLLVIAGRRRIWLAYWHAAALLGDSACHIGWPSARCVWWLVQVSLRTLRNLSSGAPTSLAACLAVIALAPALFSRLLATSATVAAGASAGSALFTAAAAAGIWAAAIAVARVLGATGKALELAGLLWELCFLWLWLPEARRMLGVGRVAERGHGRLLVAMAALPIGAVLLAFPVGTWS